MSLTNIERRKRMIQLRAKGATYEEIAKIYNLTRQRAYQIVNTPEPTYPHQRSKGIDKDLAG